MNKVSLIVLLGCFVFLISCRQETGKLFENNKVTFTSEQQSFKDGKDCDLPDSLMNDCATLNIAHLQPQSKNTDLNKAKDELRNRVQSVLAGLQQCGVQGLPILYKENDRGLYIS